ncbi:MAG: hypothetical protein E5X10_10405 [Mesorhizobium sp.]|nr:MAG: hypothetical protein E5X10_10405 [Mesorhizobium sp.]
MIDAGMSVTAGCLGCNHNKPGLLALRDRFGADALMMEWDLGPTCSLLGFGFDHLGPAARRPLPPKQDGYRAVL